MAALLNSRVAASPNDSRPRVNQGMISAVLANHEIGVFVVSPVLVVMMNNRSGWQSPSKSAFCD